MSERDYIHVASDPVGECGRVLSVTPWQVGVRVAHHEIAYGTILESVDNGYVLKLLKRTIFHAVCRAIIEASSRTPGAPK